MSINLYDVTIIPMRNALLNLSAILKKGSEHCTTQSQPESTLEQANLVPDMFALNKQVITACNTAKFLAVRTVNHPEKSWADDEKTFAEMQERIRQTVEFLDGVPREKFADENLIKQPAFNRGFKFDGALDYAVRFALPNFYFHVVTAYAILRAKGVDVGKLDYLAGGIGMPEKVEQ